ncbi:hypothetical protein DL89DRAFT_61707 [Linderina pennispora]|uniref:Uncharacterized protein n=1 Tax=Linderina pennispora TaxID=61395 RepID=A0A1Y1W080_9FUNG|nr:uncharacterized protein DL89DRAFT_61707 [Linderina pennispora]ORX66930.1 hypothetical protein DL89DRAFT_61707 [Linderina pennispora]
MDDEPLQNPAVRTSLINGSNIAADIQGALAAHMVPGPSDFYPSNEDSDEGDSIMGSALETPDNDNTDNTDEVGRYALCIRHIDAFSTSDAEITAFSDEMFSEVLYRALSVFTLAPALKSGLCLHAQVQQRNLVPLNNDGQVSSFLDYLREATHATVPESGDINPSLCTIILSDKSLPRSRLLPDAAHDAAEDDPYMDIDDSSKNILRTSIATSLSESVGVAASDSESIMTNQSPVDTLRKDLPLPATASKETAVEAPLDRNEPSAPTDRNPRGTPP